MAFQGTERFELIRQVARGGMGVIYEAYDRVRSMRVAIKTLSRFSGDRLWRFKREFRALSNVAHPNIVGLYELFCEDGTWFFTMEFIEGQDMLSYVRKDAAGPALTTAALARNTLADATLQDEGLEQRLALAGTPTLHLSRSMRDSVGAGGQDSMADMLRKSGTVAEMVAPVDVVAEYELGEQAEFAQMVDIDRLNDALGQLAQALDALHRIGMVHCDLKPSNILVTREGRLVLIDFGISTALRSSGRGGEEAFEGTPAFMAPEQIRREAPTAATDWYAYGIILYRILSGRLPHDGSIANILLGKQEADPPGPDTFTRGIPRHFIGLCMRLLARDPARRPIAQDILDVLGISQAVAPDERPAAAVKIGPAVFVGRQRERELLGLAYATAISGRMQGVLVEGPSGIGKSSLIEHMLRLFADASDEPGDESGDGASGARRGRSGSESSGQSASASARWFATRAPPPGASQLALAEDDDEDGEDDDGGEVSRAPLMLVGRCRPRESLAYKAFDDVIDELSRALAELPAPARQKLLPRDIQLLARVFPVLRRLPECAQTSALAGSLVLRSQAIDVLRELLSRLASERVVIIHIDDLQWADQDSFDLLVELLDPPLKAGVLVVATLNSDAIAAAADAYRLGEGGEIERDYVADGEMGPIMRFLERWRGYGHCRRLTLGPLSELEQAELLRALAGGRAEQPEPQSVDEWAAVAAQGSVRGAGQEQRGGVGDWLLLQRESGGHPMLLAELLRCIAEGAVPRETSSLEDILWARTERLSEPARALIWAASVIGEPAPLQVLAEVAGLPPLEYRAAVFEAEASHLFHLTHSGSMPWFDVAHTKVREAVLARLPVLVTRKLHRDIATAIEAWDETQVASLAHHWMAAGEGGAAAVYLLRAAEDASDKLAFERANDLYRAAAEVLSTSAGDRDADTLRCEAWLGLARNLRVQERGDEALALLAEAQELADGQRDTDILAAIHTLRGNLLFPSGNLDGCLDEHQRGHTYAIRSGAPALEADALSGLGDAYYLRGRILTASEYFDRCVLLCRQHRLEQAEAANLPMRGLMRFYCNDFAAALQDGTDAVALAVRIGHARAELNALVTCLGRVWAELGWLDDAREALEGAQVLARRLNSKRFEAQAMTFLGRLLGALGQIDEARQLLSGSWAILRRAGPRYLGPSTLGALALYAETPEQSRQYLQQGTDILRQGASAVNHLYFYRDAIEVALVAHDYTEVERQAALLAEYTGDQQLPWSRFFIERGLLLSDYARGARDRDILSEIANLSQRAHGIGYHMAARWLDRALEESGYEVSEGHSG